MLAKTAPEQAIVMRPGLAEAQASFARQALGKAVASQKPDDAGPAASAARLALLASPVSENALGLWMQTQYMIGRKRSVLALEEVSDSISYRDPGATLALTLMHAEANDTEKAVRRIDYLMRTAPEARPALTPILAQLTSSPEVVDRLVAVLSVNPPWRSRFLQALGNDAANSEGAWSVFAGLAKTKAVATEDELTPWFLVNTGTLDPFEMRRRWMMLFGQKGTNATDQLIDGGFDGKSGPPPMAWYLPNADQAVAELRTVPGFGRGKSLYATHLGSENSLLARQLLFLPSGNWVAEFMMGSDLSVEGQALQISLTCREGGQLLSSRNIAVLDEPKRIRAQLSVPASCPAQFLNLTALANPTQATVSFFVDEVSISPAGRQ